MTASGAAGSRRLAVGVLAVLAPVLALAGDAASTKDLVLDFERSGVLKELLGKTLTVAKSFDAGAPIRCQHDVAYPPVQSVQVPETQADDAPRASSLGMEIHVEAFDEPDDASGDLRLPLTTDEDDDLPLGGFPELVFSVDQNQAALGAYTLSLRK